MENENRCFFSISLENGITLTGDHPGSVRKFLYEMHNAFYELGDHYSKKKRNNLANEAFTNMKQIEDAINTINNNYHE